MSKKFKVILAVLVALVIATSALVIGVAAIENEPALEINAANLSFESTVHLWYCVGYENIDNPGDIKLLVWREKDVTHIDNCVKGTESAVLNSSGNVNEDGIVGKAFDYDALNAADMTETIYARAYIEIGEEKIYSPVVKYSILQYALNKLGVTGTATENQLLTDTLEAMLVYGAASQKLFNVNVDRLASKDYVKIQTSVGEFKDGSTTGLFQIGEEVKVFAPTTDDKPYAQWTDANGKIVGSGAEYTFYAKNNVSISATVTEEEMSFGAYKYVVMIGVDGAGDFYWGGNASTPNIDAIFKDSAVTRTMKTTAPTSSGPSWTTILHGSLVEHHGVNDNALVEGATGIPFPLTSKYPSFFRLARENFPSAKLEAIYGWQAFDNMIEEGIGVDKTNPEKALSQSVWQEGVTQQDRIDRQNTINVLNAINSDEMPKLLFMHYGNVDTVGHAKKWNSTEYHAELTKVDGYIGQIYAALEAKGVLNDTLFIVTSDHGGYNGDTRHGGISDAEQMAMFAVKGRTVKNGTIGDMWQCDVAAVVLTALGIEIPETYTAKVPANLFSDVEGSERVIYQDVDNPRYHETEATPAVGSADYITNFVNNNLSAYVTFDGNITVNGNGGLALGSQKGTLVYEPGYFGEAISLEHGSFQLYNFAPGTESFTIALWVKTPAINLTSPLLSERAQSNLGLTDYPGFHIYGIKNANGTFFSSKFHFNGNQTYEVLSQLPGDYQYGWMHVTMIVDRANNKVGMCYDFGEIQWTEMPEEMIGKSFDTKWKDLWFGTDASGSFYNKADYAVDEFMLFDGALSRNELNDLCEYYGKKPVVADEKTLLDVLGDKEDLVYLDFDNNTNDSGSKNEAVNTYGNVNYTAGVKGNALELGKNNAYLQLPEYTVGTNSFSFACWVKTTDLFVAPSGSGNNEYIPLFSNMTAYSGKGDGMSFILDYRAQHPNYIPPCEQHPSGYMWPSCQIYYFNASDTSARISGSSEFNDTLLNHKWTHIAITVDKAAATYSLYINFEKVLTNSISTFPVDLDGPDGSYFTIGQYSTGTYVTPPEVHIDEVVILKDALTDADIAAMKAFYNK